VCGISNRILSLPSPLTPKKRKPGRWVSLGSFFFLFAGDRPHSGRRGKEEEEKGESSEEVGKEKKKKNGRRSAPSLCFCFGVIFEERGEEKERQGKGLKKKKTGSNVAERAIFFNCSSLPCDLRHERKKRGNEKRNHTMHLPHSPPR